METISEEYTHRLLACAYTVHSLLGPGLLESIYEKALMYELTHNGFKVERQVPIEVMYKGVELGEAYRMDLLVDGKVIIEIKSVRELLPVHFKQLLTYLKLQKFRYGYLINFDVNMLKYGINRVVNGY
jgi:hypothetical protein